MLQERPNYYLAATYRYKYQAVKAFQATREVLKDESRLRAYFLHDLVSGILYGSNWFVVVLGVLPLPEQERPLTEALRAKGRLIRLDAALLRELLTADGQQQDERTDSGKEGSHETEQTAG